MASIKFLLRNKTNTKPVSINYSVNLSANKRLRGSTKLTIQPQYWDDNKQRIRNVTDVSDVKDNINTKLSEFKSFVLKKLSEYEFYENSRIEKELKKDINIFLGNIEEEKILTFYSFADKFIERSRNRTIEGSNRKISNRTIKEYERTILLLKDFEKKYKYEVSFESIDMNFYGLFLQYLEKMNFSPNTIGKFVKQVKVFMNAALDENLHTNLAFKNKRFTKPTSTSTQIYLSEVELEKIISLDLSNHPKLENARNLFVIGAYTGLRVSDFNNLTKENIRIINGKRFFNVLVRKTNKLLPIPIHPIIESILNISEGNLPKRMPEQHINIALKEIGFLAGLNDVIMVNKTKGGKKLTEIKKKYELITNHTARRSFCTNAYKAGMPTLDIMAISGHTSEKVFLNYIKITPEQRALKIAENPFFQKNNEFKII